jgi:DNA-binding transcriptional MocR family regulator
MVKAGDTVFLERPSYDRAITSMKRAGARIIGIPLEKDGVDIDRLKAELTTSTPKVFYLIPDFQNPSGVTTSSEKRKELVRLAEECGFYLVEDAPYRLLRYRGKEAPALRDLLPDRVIHISSFSKTLSPGMRIGYMILPLALAPSFHKWSEDTYIHPVLPTEGIVNEYCRKGLLEPNIEKLKNLYRPRLDAILNALRQHLKGATWIEPEGGFFVSVTLPEAIDGHALWKNARDFGIVLTDGRGFFPDGKGENFVRLPFCALRPDEIEEGIRRLTKAIDAHRK